MTDETNTQHRIAQLLTLERIARMTTFHLVGLSDDNGTLELETDTLRASVAVGHTIPVRAQLCRKTSEGVVEMVAHVVLSGAGDAAMDTLVAFLAFHAADGPF